MPPATPANEQPQQQDNFPRRYEYPAFAFAPPSSNNLSWVVGILAAGFVVATVALFMYVQNVRSDFKDQLGDMKSTQRDVQRTAEAASPAIAKLDRKSVV